MNQQIEIYQSEQGEIEINVQFQEETVWLTQAQMVELFQKTKQNISLHIKNIFKEGELSEISVVKDYLTTAKDGKKYKVKYYNLDVIISVGYRVKSQQGTQFRKWATSKLKDLLLKGYAVNEKRLAQKELEIQELKSGIKIMSRAISTQAENKGMKWLDSFAIGLGLLDDYDHEALDKKGKTLKKANYPTMEAYRQLIDSMRKEFDSAIFGKEKDENFNSSVAQIEKGFGKEDFYPSIEEKATMLLYLITKNHSFVDGNKRIAAACFLLFLVENNLLFDEQEKAIISNEALASLTLYIASSKPEEMETVKKLIVSVLNRNQQ